MPGRAFGKIRDGLLSITYPSQCRVCLEMIDSWEDGVVCHRCWGNPSITTLLFDKPVCHKCGIPLLHATSTTEAFCGRCESLEYSAARACGLYAGALEESILFLKTAPHICPRLRSIIEESVSIYRATLACEVVIPVPLHQKRRQERGFNQAEIIARVVSSQLGVDLDTKSFIRVKHTERHRAGMDAVDRMRSIEKAFKLARPRLIEGLSVLLVDDVYTTGSTMLAAAKTLLEGGARQVSIITIARVLPYRSTVSPQPKVEISS